MGKIYVFGPNDSENDYSTQGLAGVLQATECTFKETGNGDSIVTLSHPLDEWGRYTNLVRDNILLVPVPVRTTPEIEKDSEGNSYIVTTVQTCTVKPEGQISKSQRTLYKNQNGSGSMHIMEGGEQVTVVSKPSGDSSTWKVKTKYGTGWMFKIALNEGETHTIEDNSNSIELVQSPWTVMPQPFRIYDVNRTLDSVQVTARHISYDLLYNITSYKSEDAVGLPQVLDGVMKNCDNKDHGFNAYTNVANEQVGLDYTDKNPIEVFLDPEEGVCKKFDVNLVRDNHDLYFLHDPGLNRGIIIRYGKNMTDIEFEESDDEVVTRIIPRGENKDGSHLYLVDGVGTFSGSISAGAKGDKVRTMQSMLVKAGYSVGSTGVDGIWGSRTTRGLNAFQQANGLPVRSTFDNTEYSKLVEVLHLGGDERYIDSPNIGKYAVPHTYVLDCEDCKVGEKEDGKGKVDIDTARERMRAQALKMFEEGCDEPKIKMRVEFQNLGDTAEYAEYKNLENCFLFDYVIVQHKDHGIDVTARIVGIEWDVIFERMNSVEIGEIGQTMANTGITSWQIPSGFSGSKISFGTIGAGQLADGSVTASHIQSESINTRHLVAEEIAAFTIEAITGKFKDLAAERIDTKELFAHLVETDELFASLATIGKADITFADINFADIENLVAQIATVTYLAARNGSFDFATVQKLISSALIVERAVEDKVYINNLIVNSASMVSATIGDLVLESTDGKYFHVLISGDGSISTEEVQLTDAEKAAGITFDGHPIVATTINADQISGSYITGTRAEINSIFTAALDAGKINANKAMIASATIPELYTAAIKALEKDLVLAAESSIQLVVGDYARRFMSGTRNYIPGSLFLKYAQYAHTNYHVPLVGSAIVGISSVADESESWVTQTILASAINELVASDAYLLLVENNTKAEVTPLSGWNVKKKTLGTSVVVRLDSYTPNSNVQGVLPLAYEWNGEYYPFDVVGKTVVADAICTNELASSGAKAVTSVRISVIS